MKIWDLLELAARNIRESRLRNALTALGIAVGVASLVSMLSLGIGLQRLASTGIQRSGLLDTLTVTPAGNGGGRGFNGAGRATVSPGTEPRALDETARLEMAKLPEVREVYPNLLFSAELRLGEGTARRSVVSATPASAKDSEAFASIQGKFFSSASAAEVLLLKNLAAELAGAAPGKPPVPADLAKQLVGKKLTLSYAERTATPDGGFNVVFRIRTVEIVGIVDRDTNGGGGRGPDGTGGVRVFVPLVYAEGLHAMQGADLRDGGLGLAHTPTYTALVVRLKSPAGAAAAEAAIRKMGFNTFSVIDVTSGLRQVFAVIDLFLGAFGSLALAVASIGIVNTLVMAILERRREIGIMKAVGASDMDVRKIFLAEAAVLGLCGGVFGVTLGWAIGRIINFGAGVYMQSQGVPKQDFWFVPWWLVLGALVFSLVASLLSGAYPAARAARLDPVEALRYE
jgi:putative ABC transport system permease protein